MSDRKVSTSVSIDIEMQQIPQRTETENITGKRERMKALQSLFGYSAEQLQQLPSAMSWCGYLEECFQPFLRDDFASIWIAIGSPRPKTGEDCWTWFATVSASIVRFEDAGTSIEDIWDAIHTSSTVAQTGLRTIAAKEKSACLVAIFAVLCWGSMTLSPKLNWPDPAASPCLAVQHLKPEHQGLKMDFVERPISAVFRHLQRSRVGNRWRPPINAAANGDSTVLYVSSLNFSSLRIMGKVRLKWVDNINSHLDFESRTRTLSIFRYPSFCALTALGDNRGVVFEELARALYSTDADTGREYACNLQLSQEILMSYRILFGQTYGSRHLARKELQILNQERSRDYDDLLDSLCTEVRNEIVDKLPKSLWPVSCRDFDDDLQEADSYSSYDDFPMFGQRLVAIQTFNLRQRPSRLRDLWRDRRNPLQWYTFWAVLIVGGASVILAILQLIVAIVAIPVNPPCDCR